MSNAPSYHVGCFADSNGYIYVLDSGRILKFEPDPDGTADEAPLATSAGSNTQLDGGNDNLAVDASGAIYAANRNANPSGTLNEAPIATIAGSNTGLSSQTNIAIVGSFYADSVKRKAKGRR